jgi:hypothetical protein
MQARALPIAYVISIGSPAVLGVDDFLEVLADDLRIGGMGVYLEAIPDIAAFARAALALTLSIDALVVMKDVCRIDTSTPTGKRLSSCAGRPPPCCAPVRPRERAFAGGRNGCASPRQETQRSQACGCDVRDESCSWPNEPAPFTRAGYERPDMASAAQQHSIN